MNEEKQKTILVLFDWSNIKRAIAEDMDYQPGHFDHELGFSRMNDWLSQFGKVVWVLIYTPMHDVYAEFEFFQRQGFTIVLCPKLAIADIDTTDRTIIRDGKVLIDSFKELDYFCLASGDKHFVELLQKAKQRGAKVAVVYGSNISLSGEVKKMADYDLATRKELLHLFDPKID